MTDQSLSSAASYRCVVFVFVVQAGAHLCIAHRLLTAELDLAREQLLSWAAGLLSENRDLATSMLKKVGKEGVTAAMTAKGQQRDAQGPEAGDTDSNGTSERPETESLKRRQEVADDPAVHETDTGGSSERQGKASGSPAGAETGADTRNGRQLEGKEASPTSRQERYIGLETSEGQQEEGGGTGCLLTRIRRAWRTAEAEVDTGLQQRLQEVAYRTIPTSPKQVGWRTFWEDDHCLGGRGNVSV